MLNGGFGVRVLSQQLQTVLCVREVNVGDHLSEYSLEVSFLLLVLASLGLLLLACLFSLLWLLTSSAVYEGLDLFRLYEDAVDGHACGGSEGVLLSDLDLGGFIELVRTQQT